MSKNKNNKKSPLGKVALVVGIVAVLAVLAIFVMPGLLYRLRSEAPAGENDIVITDDADKSNSDGQEGDVNTFPLALENGKLLLESIMQFDGINPDCGNENGHNIATISLTNRSGIYLKRAEISVTTEDGQLLTFVVTDVPAGKSVMAFATDNAALKKDAVYSEVACNAEFDSGTSMNDTLVQTSVDGTHITVTNITDTAITNLVVYCHCTLGDQYFGGVTYNYTIDNLAVDETAELDAAECILGLAEVVKITVGEP